MKFLYTFFAIISVCFSAFGAEVLDLDVALQNTYRACVGIDDELADLKKMAGINTAVTSVGTGLGVSATAVGIEKVRTDKEIEEFENYIKELEKAAAQQTERPTRVDISDEQIDALFVDIEKFDSDKSKLEKLNKKSKSLGNWRTGLMAGATATNIAGAAIAGASLKKGDIQGRIDDCLATVSDLRTSIAKAKTEGIDVREAQTIANACSGYMGQDVSKIQKQAKGSLVSSVIGATTGLTGTVTSAVANTDGDKQKEKNLNVASNVLAGATTVASGTATVFNATQISAIKKVATVATKCTEVLK